MESYWAFRYYNRTSGTVHVANEWFWSYSNASLPLVQWTIVKLLKIDKREVIT